MSLQGVRVTERSVKWSDVCGQETRGLCYRNGGRKRERKYELKRGGGLEYFYIKDSSFPGNCAI